MFASEERVGGEGEGWGRRGEGSRKGDGGLGEMESREGAGEGGHCGVVRGWLESVDWVRAKRDHETLEILAVGLE